MIIVRGFVHARADSIEAARRLSLEHVARSRREPGCLEHGVAVDADDALRLVFFERWSDRATLDAHFRLPASRDFVTALTALTALAARPPHIEVYEVAPAAAR